MENENHLEELTLKNDVQNNSDKLKQREERLTKPEEDIEQIILQKVDERITLLSKEFYSFSGPIPHPDLMEQYDKIVPGSGKGFFERLDREQISRTSMNRISTVNSIIMSYLGITFAFLSVIILSGLVYYALTKGFDTTAGAISVGAIAAVAGVFIFFRRSSKKS